MFAEECSREEGRNQRFHLLALDAYARHKKFINDYILYFHGATSLLKRDTSRDKTDLDIIRENHQFLWSSNDDAETTWGKRIAKKYYDKLFKEYAISDLSRYKENKIAFRWRVEKEVIDGKGQFICGNKVCSEKDSLRSWEVNFTYTEFGEKKRALVKLRLCPECSYKLNYHYQNKEVKPKKRKRKERETNPTSKRVKSSKIEPSKSQSNEESTSEDKTETAESEIWKAPVVVEDKSRDEEFDEYFEDLFL